MDQRIYYGNINPHALADYLVGVFHQQPPFSYHQHRTMAQKVVQGERIYVQIMRSGDWVSSGHRAIGVHIQRIAGGISVGMGASDWLDMDETGLAGMLLGVLLFPPLLLFPLIQGLTSSSFVQDIWDAIETYCAQYRTQPSGRAHAPQGFYCTYCGAFNHPSASRCHACHAPFDFAPPPRPTAQSASKASSSTTSAQEFQAEENAPQAKGETRPMFKLVTCPTCKASVAPARFCGNCAAPLPEESREKNE
jgi:hypothetical protein